MLAVMDLFFSSSLAVLCVAPGGEEGAGFLAGECKGLPAATGGSSACLGEAHTHMLRYSTHTLLGGVFFGNAHMPS